MTNTLLFQQARADVWARFAATTTPAELPVQAAARADALLAEFDKRFKWDSDAPAETPGSKLVIADVLLTAPVLVKSIPAVDELPVVKP